MIVSNIPWNIANQGAIILVQLIILFHKWFFSFVKEWIQTILIYFKTFLTHDTSKKLKFSPVFSLAWIMNHESCPSEVGHIHAAVQWNIDDKWQFSCVLRYSFTFSLSLWSSKKDKLYSYLEQPEAHVYFYISKFLKYLHLWMLKRFYLI